MQAAIYTRLSLERDANAENCAIQEVECREYAEGLGWEVVAVFSDSDIDSEELAAALRDSTRPEISGLMETYDSQRTKLNDLIADYASGLLNREQLARAKAVVEEAMEATKAKLAKVESGRALISLPAGESVRQAWERSDLTWRRSLISLLVVRVVLHPSRPGRMRWEGLDGRSWTFDPTKVTIEWRP
jgi:predicted RecB family endonuclease